MLNFENDVYLLILEHFFQALNSSKRVVQFITMSLIENNRKLTKDGIKTCDKENPS